MSTSKTKPKATKKTKAAKKSPAKKTAKASFAPGSDALAVAPAAITDLVAALVSFTPRPAVYDPIAAQALVTAFRPRLLAVAPDRIRYASVDVHAVSQAALQAHALTEAPALRACFEAAAKAGLFKIEGLALLRDLALALFHLYRLADAAGAFASTAKVPAEVDAKSFEVEARMQKQCEHFFSAHDKLGPVVRRLSPGIGFRDRAYDLLGYADIYEEQHAIVSKDPVFYVATDVADARRLAGEILSLLGAAMTPQAREAQDLLHRAFTIFEAVYNEVRALGLYVLRHDPRREERFPSLYAIGRPGKRKRKGGEEAVEEEGAGVQEAPPTKKDVGVKKEMAAKGAGAEETETETEEA